MLLAEAYYQIGRVHARASAVYTLQNKPNESERLYDQSERDFQKAIALCHKHSPTDMPEYHPTLLADIHFEKGRLYTDREIRLGFAIQEYEFAGLNYEDLRYLSHAVKAYNAVVKIDPDYANPYFYLGRTYERYAVACETEEFDKYIEVAIAYYRLALQKSVPTEDSTGTSARNAQVKSASQTRFNTPQLMLQARYGLARCYDYIHDLEAYVLSDKE